MSRLLWTAELPGPRGQGISAIAIIAKACARHRIPYHPRLVRTSVTAGSSSDPARWDRRSIVPLSSLFLPRMNRIDAAFRDLRLDGSTAVIPFIVGGHPSRAASEAMLRALAEAGAKVIEIGVPFSDPIADGPVIAQAMKEAIDRGATPALIFDMVRAVRASIDAGIVLMVSVSIVERMGRANFVEQARSAGVDGLIVPDLDLEEAPSLSEQCRAAGLALTLLAAPASGRERLQRLAEISQGFLYLLARQGVTGDAGIGKATASGAAATGDGDLEKRVAELRSLTGLPIACGFGVATAEQVSAITRHADAAIVGSAFVRRVGSDASRQQAAAAASEFYRELSAGLSRRAVLRTEAPGRTT